MKLSLEDRRRALESALAAAAPDMPPAKLARLAWHIQFAEEWYRVIGGGKKSAGRLRDRMDKVVQCTDDLLKALDERSGWGGGLGARNALNLPVEGDDNKSFVDTDALIGELVRLRSRAKAAGALCSYSGKRAPDRHKNEFLARLIEGYESTTGLKAGFSIGQGGAVGGPFVRVLMIAASYAGIEDSARAWRRRFQSLNT